MDILQKEKKLKQTLSGFEKIAVAFSGGVDSSYLLKIANEVLGENAIAVTLNTDFLPRSELEDACSFARQYNIPHHIINFDVFQVENITANPKNRCYICKKNGFKQIKQFAAGMGISTIADGSNADDALDDRPGATAIKELGIISPLQESGLTKDEIRLLSKQAGLLAYNKPANACLATRIPYGDTITAEKLQKIEKAEDFLHTLGFEQVRVRVHGDLARIELPSNVMQKMFLQKEEISNMLKEIGFTYVSLDLQGYRSGSMSENQNGGFTNENSKKSD